MSSSVRRVVLPAAGAKNVLITSALPYVNNTPHLGNLVGSVLSADVFHRFCQLRGVNSFFVCGTDEYGTATEAKAASEGSTPREVCDKYHAIHSSVYDFFNIGFDVFGRTSCPDPANDAAWPQTAICQDIFNDLHRAGLIVEQTVDQMYCGGCSKFLADRMIEGTCPHCGDEGARGDQCDACGKLVNTVELKAPRCAVDPTHSVTSRTSRQLFLDLPSLTPALKDWLDTVSPSWSSNASSITAAWLREGLRQRCITRDLQWGTPVPLEGFTDKVFYVWFDAPIGYISMTAAATPEWRQWWHSPDNVELVQFMGKDNVPFHSVMFPASLIGTGKSWTLPSRLSATAYLNYEGGKFSKSRNLGVFGDEAASTDIPADVWRYYLMSIRPESADTMFNWEELAERNNAELLNNLGNLTHRVLSFTWTRFDGKVPGIRARQTDREAQLEADVSAVVTEYVAAMEALNLRQGLRLAMRVSALGNQYLQDVKPWATFKSNPDECATSLTYGWELLRLLSALMEPFMPQFSSDLRAMLRCGDVDIPADGFRTDAGRHTGAIIDKPTPMFRRIGDEEVAGYRDRFGTALGDKEADPEDDVGPSAAFPPVEDRPALVRQFQRLELRAGTVLSAAPHPDADRLTCLVIDTGSAGDRRNIVAGVPVSAGDRVSVLCNLKPRKLRGQLSEGMLLCAVDDDAGVVEPVVPPSDAAPGTAITYARADGDDPAPSPDDKVNPSKKNSPWVAVGPYLHVDGQGRLALGGRPLEAGPASAPLTVPTLRDAHVR